MNLMTKPPQLYIVTFNTGDEDTWEVTTAYSMEEAERKISEYVLEEFGVEVEHIEAFLIPNVDGYNVKLTKQPQITPQK